MKKTKNIILLISGIIGGGLILLEPITTSQMCNFIYRTHNPNSVHIGCLDYIFNTAMVFYIFPFVFLFSLVTYFLKDEIFHIWVKFTYVWIPLSMFLVLIIPGGGGNGAFPSLIDNQFVAILMSGLFAIISLIIVIFGIVKYYCLKHN
jgi:hypothetical protein